MLFTATAVNGTPVSVVFSSIDGFGETAKKQGWASHGIIFSGNRNIETRETYAELLETYAKVASAQTR